MSAIENKNGVSSKERTQVKGPKDMTTAQKLAKFAKLNNHPYVESDVVEDRGSGKVQVQVLEG